MLNSFDKRIRNSFCVYSLVLVIFGESYSFRAAHRAQIITKGNTILHISSEKSYKQENSVIPPWLPTFSTAAIGGLLFGYDIGSSSSVVRILGTGLSDFGSLDPIQLGQVASSSLFGAMLASAAIIYAGDGKIGRKFELIGASALFGVGTLVQSLGTSLPFVLLGRIIYGLGIGTAMHVAPLYIAETSPNNLRGKLVSFKEAAIVAGIVLGYAGGAAFGESLNWRYVFESALPLEALMLVGALYVPESPRWLALRGRPEEAVEALQIAQGVTREEATVQVNEMVRLSSADSVGPATSSSTSVVVTNGGNSKTDTESDSVIVKMKSLFASPYNRQALLIGVGLVLFQQLSGQPSVLYFANRIFEGAGLGYEAAVGVGVFKFIMTLVSASLVENPNWGRRQLLLYGNAGITASLLGLSALYGYGAISPDHLPNQPAIISCILLFVGCYQIGFGPITWLILSEIFPLKIRSAAVSLGTLANFASNLLIALVFEAERLSIGESLLFLQFAVIAGLATLFTYTSVFETRGLSLEEIEEKLTALVDSNRSARDVDKSDGSRT